MSFRTFVLLSSMLLSLHASEGKPFIHPFGELRVYFGDWLVVCGNAGQGECRMVSYLNYTHPEKQTGFFPESRLSIVPKQGSNLPHIEFYDRYAPPIIEGITLRLGSQKIRFGAHHIEMPSQSRILETYTVRDSFKISGVLKRAKESRWLCFAYQYSGNATKEVCFSLRGFTKAYHFIKQQHPKH